ncbi:UbiD family decarboxylase, partial [Chloroflexota bacterium]
LTYLHPTSNISDENIFTHWQTGGVMIFDDLRGFLTACEKEGELTRIEESDWDIEIGAITQLVAEKLENSTACLFDKIKGYQQGYRVASNLYNSRRRCSLAVGLPPDSPKIEIVKALRRAPGASPLKPREVKTGPVMENTFFGDDVKMTKFPSPKWHEGDGGRYMGTCNLVIMKDPDEGWINASVQRMMLQDDQYISLWISPGKDNYVIRDKYFARGQNVPVAVAFSPDPLLFLSGVFPVPWGISELDWAGMLRKAPVDVIHGQITGLPFPANAEIVIEGECLLPENEMRMEGPFGEWTGYYAGGRHPAPVVRVKALYHRNDPILAGVPPMKPPVPSTYPVLAAPMIWDSLETAGIHGIRGVWNLESGGDRLITVISLKQDHSGHAKRAGLIAATSFLVRAIIVVDDDIDPTNTGEVLWAVSTRCDPATQIDIVRNCWGGPVDPRLTPEQREQKDYSHSTAIIDACRPFHWKDKFPIIDDISEETRKKYTEKWREKLGL